jgi:hypothetical protein
MAKPIAIARTASASQMASVTGDLPTSSLVAAWPVATNPAQ